jgi:type I restriction enzyme S subunit
VLDGYADGATLRMKRHQIARASQVILSEIWGKKGAIGFVPSEGEGALCTSHFFLFNLTSEQVDPRYLQLIFRGNYLESQLNVEAKGTTGYASIRPRHLLGCEIPLPPLAEQRRIVSRIEALITQIAEARALRQQAVEEVEVLMASFIAQALKEVSLDGCLGDVLLERPRNGWSAKCDNSEGGTPVLRLGAVTHFRYDQSEFKRTSETTSPHAHYWLMEGDLLISRSNTPDFVGHAAIYNGSPSPCIYPDLMMRLKVDRKRVNTRFVHYWLRSATVRDYISRNAKGTSPTMKKISQGTVMGIPFPSGQSLSNQSRIVAHLERVEARVNALKHIQAETNADMNALLPAIFDRTFKGER